MKYAVLSISGSQYLIEEGTTLTLDLQKAKEGEKIISHKVLLFTDGTTTQIGTPTLSNVAIQYEVLKNYKGKKLRVATYKAKSRYRRVIGFKPHLTNIKILSIKVVTKTTTKSKPSPKSSPRHPELDSGSPQSSPKIKK